MRTATPRRGGPRAGRPRPGRVAWSTTNTTGTRAPPSSTSRSLAGVVVDGRDPTPRAAVGRATTSAPTSSWTQSTSGSSTGSADRTAPCSASAASRDGHADEVDDPAVLDGLARAHLEGAVGDVEHRARVEPLDAVGHQGDDHLALEPVGLVDPPDLEEVGGRPGAAPQSTNSTSTDTPSLHGGRPHDGADRLRDAAPLADDPTHVAVGRPCTLSARPRRPSSTRSRPRRDRRRRPWRGTRAPPAALAAGIVLPSTSSTSSSSDVGALVGVAHEALGRAAASAGRGRLGRRCPSRSAPTRR